jgi:hypothetical protein
VKRELKPCLASALFSTAIDFCRPKHSALGPRGRRRPEGGEVKDLHLSLRQAFGREGEIGSIAE